jgi:hypothetical protein
MLRELPVGATAGSDAPSVDRQQRLRVVPPGSGLGVVILLRIAYCPFVAVKFPTDAQVTYGRFDKVPSGLTLSGSSCWTLSTGH